MAHLADIRIGWENEHLAAYLLSRISFIANPITIGDDIGSDFLCTLFEQRLIYERRQLFPRRSFAIQIKSILDRYSVDDKIEYLNRLELPFFLGIVQQSKLSLSIYSGQFLPMMFTELGVPSKLTLCPVKEEALTIDKAYTRDPAHCKLMLPFVARLSANETQKEFDSKRECVACRCAQMQANISTKISEEYIYRLDDAGSIQIQAGPGSIKTYRRNLYLRLTEAFYNLEWLIEHDPDKFDREEYELYVGFYASLKERESNLLVLLDEVADRLRKKVNTKDKKDA